METLVTLASQDSSWCSGWQLLSFPRNTISGSFNTGAASIVVELDQAARSVASIAIKPGNDVRKHFFDDVIWIAGSICAGAYSHPRTAIAGDTGHDAYGSPACCSRRRIADYFWAFWSDWPLSHSLGISIPFTTVAVVMAQMFVSSPFFVNSARAGLEQLDPRYESAAHTLRASKFYTFWRVVLPLIRPALLTGIGLAWARALGELGATITFAGSFPGITETMPVAVYTATEVDLETAVALSVVLLAISFAVLLALQVGRSKVGAL